METLSRRDFLTKASTLTAAALVPQLLNSSRVAAAAGKTTQVNTRGFFTLAKRNGRWWFITPEGKQFFSIGLNHIDSATLRYGENAHIWRDKYGNSMEKWLEQVKEDLRNWGFNTVGWVQEVVRAAIPYVDVLSFQCFGNADLINEKLGCWGKLTDRPVLLADSSVRAKAHTPGDANEHRHPDPDAYEDVMRVLRDMPQCVGFHLCGAYLANRVRHSGLRSEQDKTDAEAIDGFTRVNRQTTQWMLE